MHDTSDFDKPARDRFVAFLERLANGDVGPEQWMELVVNHYPDKTLERIRRGIVRLRMKNEAMHWSTEEHERIQDWIRTLLTAAQ